MVMLAVSAMAMLNKSQLPVFARPLFDHLAKDHPNQPRGESPENTIPAVPELFHEDDIKMT